MSAPSRLSRKEAVAEVQALRKRLADCDALEAEVMALRARAEQAEAERDDLNIRLANAEIAADAPAGLPVVLSERVGAYINRYVPSTQLSPDEIASAAVAMLDEMRCGHGGVPGVSAKLIARHRNPGV